jgi:hypothetical protein
VVLIFKPLVISTSYIEELTVPRPSMLAAFFFLTGLASFTIADEDSTYAKIQKAKEAHQKDVARVREEVLKGLQRAEDAARKSGNKPLLDKVKQETETFEAKGTPPSVISTKESQRKLRRSRENLETLYHLSIKALTKAGKDDAADTLKNELAKFQMDEKVLEGKHYLVMKAPLTWHEARLACENQGGHLAIIHNEAQSRFLIAQLKSAGVDLAFIGATDERRERQWQWVDGTFLTYENWDREHAQPNNRTNSGQPEHYAAMLLEYQGKWWDVPNEASAYICQWD